MSQKTCMSCSGTGQDVMAVGSGFDRDYGSVCTTCGGTGSVVDYDAIRREKDQTRKRAEEAAQLKKQQQENDRQRKKKTSTPAKPSTQASPEWSWVAGIIAFLVGTGAAGAELELQGAPQFIAGGFAGIVFGFYYKYIVGLAVLGGILYAFVTSQ